MIECFPRLLGRYEEILAVLADDGLDEGEAIDVMVDDALDQGSVRRANFGWASALRRRLGSSPRGLPSTRPLLASPGGFLLGLGRNLTRSPRGPRLGDHGHHLGACRSRSPEALAVAIELPLANQLAQQSLELGLSSGVEATGAHELLEPHQPARASDELQHSILIDTHEHLTLATSRCPSKTGLTQRLPGPSR